MFGVNGRKQVAFWIVCSLLLKTAPSETSVPTVQDREYWYAQAQKDLTKRLQELSDLKPVAKSVIMFVGDGMSLATITAARELKEQRRRETGDIEGARGLIWDHFPAASLAQTYNLNAQTGESSACATALMCGVKANYETVGLDGTASFENCSSSFGARVTSILEWAQQAVFYSGYNGEMYKQSAVRRRGGINDKREALRPYIGTEHFYRVLTILAAILRLVSGRIHTNVEGKWTGIVTTTRITHATPAALFAHSPSRYWEDDSKVPQASRKSCKDIAQQLVDNHPGKNINVLLGGGRRHWLPQVTKDPEQVNSEGRRLDGRNLMDDWLREKKKRKLKAEYVWNKEKFDAIDTNNVDYLLGLFEYSHMGFTSDRKPGPNADPTLQEMTTTALNILERSPKGFFLMVEGGRIDHAHHYNNPYRALEETLQLEAAVRASIARADLLLVTSDHGHVMTIGGHGAPRDHPILGNDIKPSDIDGLPYTSILYGSGPGYTVRNPKDTTPKEVQTAEGNRIHASAAPRQWATHGAEDVPVYAMGPLATILFSGTYEQSYIPHAVAFIACLGDQAERCQDSRVYKPQILNCSETTLPRRASISQKTSSPGTVLVASSVMADDSSRRSSSKSRIYLDKINIVNIVFVCTLIIRFLGIVNSNWL